MRNALKTRAHTHTQVVAGLPAAGVAPTTRLFDALIDACIRNGRPVSFR